MHVQAEPEERKTQGGRRFGDREGDPQLQRLWLDRRQQRFVYHHHEWRQRHGQGNGHLHRPANTNTTPVTGSITIGGQTFTVTQAGVK